MNKKSIPILLVLIFSSAGSLTTLIKIGPVSISGLFSLLVPIITIGYYLASMNFNVGKFKPALPLGMLLMACIIWDLANLLENQYFPQNISIVLAGFMACIFMPRLLKLKNYEKSIFEILSSTSILYTTALAVVLVFFQEEPAFVQVGVIYFSFNIVKYFLFNDRFSLVLALLIFMATLMLNSRIVIIAELCIFGIFIVALNRSRKIMSILWLGAILVISFAFTQTSVFESAVYGGDQALEIGDVNINTSGRYSQWIIIFDSFMNNYFFGSGFSIPVEMRTVERWNHPHNDYLRLLHHVGVFGLSLWMIFIILVVSEIRKTFKLVNEFHQQTVIKKYRAITYTCTGSLIGLIIMMITDNSIVYNYVMYPIGILIGSLPITQRYVREQKRLICQSPENDMKNARATKSSQPLEKN